MGAGKSTVGRALALRQGRDFIDLDDRVERIAGQCIQALFERGETYFRDHEARALRTLACEPGFAFSGTVVATGGGVVTRPANWACMRNLGPTVYLAVPVASLVARLSAPGALASRPLLSHAGLAASIESLLAHRESSYRCADFMVDADADVAQVCDRIDDVLGDQR